MRRFALAGEAGDACTSVGVHLYKCTASLVQASGLTCTSVSHHPFLNFQFPQGLPKCRKSNSTCFEVNICCVCR